MKTRRRMRSFLAAAAAACYCGPVTEAATVRGVRDSGGGGRRRRTVVHADANPNSDLRPHLQHEQRQQQLRSNDPPPPPSRRSLRDNDVAVAAAAVAVGGEYWWHGNESNQKDVVYVPIGPYSSNVNEDKLQMLHAKVSEESRPPNALDDGAVAFAPAPFDDDDNDDEGMETMSGGGGGGGGDGNDGGRGSFSVYAISVSNEPDTSNLPYKQPTPEPTPKPTRFPTASPTKYPTGHPVDNVVVVAPQTSSSSSSSSEYDTSSGSGSGLYFFPVWSDAFEGCASSYDPPEAYLDIPGNEGRDAVRYVFANKAECCANWFHDDDSGGLACVDDDGGMEEYLGMLLETTTENGNYMSSGGGGGVTATSDDNGPAASEPNDAPDALPPAAPSPAGPPAPSPAPEDDPPSGSPPPQPILPPETEPTATLPPSPPSFALLEPERPPPAQSPVPNMTPPPARSPVPNMTPPPAQSPVPNMTPPPARSPVPNMTPPPARSPVPNMTPPPARSPVPNMTPPPARSPVPNMTPPTTPPAGGAVVGDANEDATTTTTLAPTPFDSTTTTTTTTPEPTPFDTMAAMSSFAGGGHASSPSSTTALYSESFEDGLRISNPDDEYFAWSVIGNGEWVVDDVGHGDGYDAGTHVATVGGTGKFAVESTLSLTVGGGGNNGAPKDNEKARETIRTKGAYVTFGIKTSAALPTDSLEFQLDDKVLGYWTEDNDGWESVSAYLPPAPFDESEEGDDEQLHKLTWKYSYYGSDEELPDARRRVQLDGISVEALTGDLSISDDDQYDIAVDGKELPELNLHAFGDAAWEVSHDGNAYDGSHVIGASTRKVIRAANPGNSMTTYHGTAAMSVTVITGPFGGTVHFALLSDVSAPIDVLEVAVDGNRVMAVTGKSDSWEEHSLDLDVPGKHVVTFAHISNPAFLDMSALENLGEPGSSKVDGIRYVDSKDPSLITPDPTASPTPEATASVTTLTIPVQNYCGKDLSSIQSTCYTDEAITCNDDDGPCPQGSFCWGGVKCDIPAEYMAKLRETPSPSPKPTKSEDNTAITVQNYCGPSLNWIEQKCASGKALTTCNDNDGPCPPGTFCWGEIECEAEVQEEEEEEDKSAPVTDPPTHLPTSLPPQQDGNSPQNYCGTSLVSIKASCASGNIPTCNDDDGPCPSGTFCWGNLVCDRIEAKEEEKDVVEEEKEGDEEEQTIEGFLSAFYAEDNNDVSGGDNIAAEQDEKEEAKVAEQNDPIVQDNCPEGLSPVQGLQGCCVPEPSFLGDGACDAHSPYNTAECGYDLGDCCRDSCNPDTPFGCAAKEGDDYGPFGYFCIDPNAQGIIDEEACTVENREWIGDGGCDPEYNTKECGWDGGDCCRETCDPDFAYYECGREAQPFDCKNPDIIHRAGYVP